MDGEMFLLKCNGRSEDTKRFELYLVRTLNFKWDNNFI